MDIKKIDEYIKNLDNINSAILWNDNINNLILINNEKDSIIESFKSLDSKVKGFIGQKALGSLKEYIESESQFLAAIIDLLNFCFYEAYNIYYSNYYCAKDRANYTNLLKRVRESYDSSYSLAKGFEIEQWELFFKHKNCVIADYACRNANLLHDINKTTIINFLQNLYSENRKISNYSSYRPGSNHTWYMDNECAKYANEYYNKYFKNMKQDD